LDIAASLFVHYNLKAIAWDQSSFSSSLAGSQREYGAELEASYHTEKTRVAISHGYTKLYGFYLAPDQDTYITADPYGYGNDLTNWSNHITKLTAQHKLDDKWTFDASLRIYWGFPGMKEYDKYYPYSGTDGATTGTYPGGGDFSSHPVIGNGWERSYRGSYYLDLGLQYKPSEDLIINLTGYNLLGVFNEDFNKRNYVQVVGGGDFRSHAPAIGISLLYKF
jgi:outer membrane cobalamin receptor